MRDLFFIRIVIFYRSITSHQQNTHHKSNLKKTRVKEWKISTTILEDSLSASCQILIKNLRTAYHFSKYLLVTCKKNNKQESGHSRIKKVEWHSMMSQKIQGKLWRIFASFKFTNLRKICPICKFLNRVTSSSVTKSWILKC